MAQQVRAPATKFNDLNSIPGLSCWKDKTDFYNQSSVSKYKALATMYIVDQRGTIEINPSLHFTVAQINCMGLWWFWQWRQSSVQV